MKKKNFISATIILIVVSLSLFFVRNTIRLNKEINFYDYDIIKSPYFYVKDVESKKIFDDGSFKVYTATNGDMCWAAKTPCSYYMQVNTKKFLGKPLNVKTYYAIILMILASVILLILHFIKFLEKYKNEI